jgi:hypothetical protein
MWKIILAFVVFAALALFVISKGGSGLDMSGEKHDATHEEKERSPKTGDHENRGRAHEERAHEERAHEERETDHERREHGQPAPAPASAAASAAASAPGAAALQASGAVSGSGSAGR